MSVKQIVSTGALAAALLVGGVQGIAAQAPAGGGGGQQAPAPPPIVALRKALMMSNQQHIAALRALLSGELNLPLHILKHTQALADNGAMLGALFPSSGVTTHALSRAKPEIWSNSADFTAKVQAFADATKNLNAIAQRGFNDQTLTALNAVQPTCGGCHMPYRGPAPTPTN
jgi:cytochrome c556